MNERVESVAYFLIASAILALAMLATRIPALRMNTVAWQSFAVPLVTALSQLVVGVLLLRSGSGRAAAVVLLGAQLVAISAGPLAYRLIVGPYMSFSNTPGGIRTGGGIDAAFLLVTGGANRVPPGVAINLMALAALVTLALAGARLRDSSRDSDATP